MSLLDRRVRGFRLVDLVGFGLLVVLILGVYLAKTIAGGERTDIARVERQIDSERARVRLLQAEVAHLEQPGRIEQLSSAYLGLQAVKIERETSADKLGEIAAKQPIIMPAKTQPAAAAPAAIPAVEAATTGDVQ